MADLSVCWNPKAGEGCPERSRASGEACLSLPRACSLPGTGQSQLLRSSLGPETTLSLLLFPNSFLFAVYWSWATYTQLQSQSDQLRKHLHFFHGCGDSDTAGWLIQLMKPSPWSRGHHLVSLGLNLTFFASPVVSPSLCSSLACCGGTEFLIELNPPQGWIGS